MHQLLAIALDELKRESYVKEKRMKSMKNGKEMEKFKIELMNALKTTDKPYYGLSLENLVLNN